MSRRELVVANARARKARVRAMGIGDRPTSFLSPWQNGYVERLIGSIRRECTDHLLVFNAEHLRRILVKYASYYNEVRTHVALGKDMPRRRPIERFGDIVAYTLGFSFRKRQGIGLMICHDPRSEKDPRQTRALALNYPALDIGPRQSVFVLHDRLTATFLAWPRSQGLGDGERTGATGNAKYKRGAPLFQPITTHGVPECGGRLSRAGGKRRAPQ